MARFPSTHKKKCTSLFVNVIFLFLIFCVTFHFSSSDSSSLSSFISNPNSMINYYQILDDDIGCKGLHNYRDHQAKCSYVKSHKGCQPKGYINYLQLFYCKFSPSLGYVLLAIWLLVLFYHLGDTSSSYFCSSLEGLSRSLRLSPTVAGVTLLSLGNGAPDVFDSIISFTGDGTTKDIGLNSILGGAFFVFSVVVGIISISVTNHGRKVSYSSFAWNVVFLFFCLSCFLVITIIGKINLWGALCFLSLYFMYVAFVFASETCSKKQKAAEAAPKLPPSILPVTKNSPEESAELQIPLLGFAVDESPSLHNHNLGELQVTEQVVRLRGNCQFSAANFFGKLLHILGLPLDLPRKLTIPIISEEKWCKPTAVVSTALATFLLAAIWNLHYLRAQLLIYAIGASVGFVSAILLFCISDGANPPRNYNFLWLAESFLMSITWTYILAQELISLLVSLGILLGISHSVMGLTVLAWGNSLGDLFSNVTLAKNGGPEGAQIAISGCYAGPIFNILVGLGLPQAFSSWAAYPSCFIVVRDPSLYETFGFLMIGLLWTILIVTKRKMRLDKFLGSGLLAIYLCFLALKLARTFGLVNFVATPTTPSYSGDG